MRAIGKYLCFTSVTMVLVTLIALAAHSLLVASVSMWSLRIRLVEAVAAFTVNAELVRLRPLRSVS
jgi:hypothetical protein